MYEDLISDESLDDLKARFPELSKVFLENEVLQAEYNLFIALPTEEQTADNLRTLLQDRVFAEGNFFVFVSERSEISMSLYKALVKLDLHVRLCLISFLKAGVQLSIEQITELSAVRNLDQKLKVFSLLDDSQKSFENFKMITVEHWEISYDFKELFKVLPGEFRTLDNVLKCAESGVKFWHINAFSPHVDKGLEFLIKLAKFSVLQTEAFSGLEREEQTEQAIEKLLVLELTDDHLRDFSCLDRSDRGLTSLFGIVFNVKFNESQKRLKDIKAILGQFDKMGMHIAQRYYQLVFDDAVRNRLLDVALYLVRYATAEQASLHSVINNEVLPAEMVDIVGDQLYYSDLDFGGSRLLDENHCVVLMPEGQSNDMGYEETDNYKIIMSVVRNLLQQGLRLDQVYKYLEDSASYRSAILFKKELPLTIEVDVKRRFYQDQQVNAVNAVVGGVMLEASINGMIKGHFVPLLNSTFPNVVSYVNNTSPFIAKGMHALATKYQLEEPLAAATAHVTHYGFPQDLNSLGMLCGKASFLFLSYVSAQFISQSTNPKIIKYLNYNTPYVSWGIKAAFLAASFAIGSDGYTAKTFYEVVEDFVCYNSDPLSAGFVAYNTATFVFSVSTVPALSTALSVTFLADYAWTAYEAETIFVLPSSIDKAITVGADTFYTLADSYL